MGEETRYFVWWKITTHFHLRADADGVDKLEEPRLIPPESAIFTPQRELQANLGTAAKRSREGSDKDVGAAGIGCIPRERDDCRVVNHLAWCRREDGRLQTWLDDVYLRLREPRGDKAISGVMRERDDGVISAC
jgi:hypothetical protein